MTILPPRQSSSFLGKRGPNDEIIPPMLVGDLSDEAALKALTGEAARLRVRIDVPKDGTSRAYEGLVNIALMAAQQRRLRAVFGGGAQSGVEKALYRAVVVDGDRLSLRPLGLAYLRFTSFAPVLQREEELPNGTRMAWRLGVVGHGHVERIEASTPGEAYERAVAAYKDLAEAEEASFAASAKKVKTPHTLLYDYAVWRLGIGDRTWTHSNGYALRIVGVHDHLRYDTPDESRIVQLDPAQIVKVLDTAARRRGAFPDYPTPAQMQEWLAAVHAPRPLAASWNATDAHGLPVDLRAPSEKTYLLERQGVLLRVIERRGAGAKDRAAAESVIEKPMAEAMKTGSGREAVARWALWAAGEKE